MRKLKNNVNMLQRHLQTVKNSRKYLTDGRNELFEFVNRLWISATNLGFQTPKEKKVTWHEIWIKERTIHATTRMLKMDTA